MRVLLVEEDSLSGKAVCAGLEQLGHTVDWVMDGQSAHAAVRANDYAALVLDMDLPEQGGMTLLKQLRANGHAVPVIIIMARDALLERIDDLDGDAADFIVTPLDLLELDARLRAVVRRAGGRAVNDLVHDVIRIDPTARMATVQDRLVALTAREFALLAHLLEHRGKVLSKQQLQESLYSWSDEIDSNTVEVHVHHLRRKLGRGLIKTMHGMGYMIDGHVRTG